MQTIDPPSTDSSTALRFPLRGWIALAMMIVIVGWAGTLMYERVFGSSADQRDLVDIGGGRRLVDFGQPRVQPDGIREVGNGFRVKAGDATLTVTRRQDGQWSHSFGYDRPDMLNPEQQTVFTARFRLVRDAAFAKSLNLTEDQMKKLREIPAREGMVVSDPDRRRVEALFDEYVKAPPPREQPASALLAALREVGNNSLEPTRQVIAERVRQIQAILTPEQIARFKQPAN